MAFRQFQVTSFLVSSASERFDGFASLQLLQDFNDFLDAPDFPTGFNFGWAPKPHTVIKYLVSVLFDKALHFRKSYALLIKEQTVENIEEDSCIASAHLYCTRDP